MLKSEPAKAKNPLLCYYTNSTHKMEIIRITNISNWYFEKTIFPQERLMFEAFPEAILEIHTKIMGSSVLLAQIQCDLLSVEDGVSRLAVDFA